MPQYTQRKWFDDRTLADEQEKAFHAREFRVPGIVNITRVEAGDGGFWLYLTQDGDLVSDDHQLILPDYERIA